MKTYDSFMPTGMSPGACVNAAPSRAFATFGTCRHAESWQNGEENKNDGGVDLHCGGKAWLRLVVMKGFKQLEKCDRIILYCWLIEEE